MRIRKSWPSGWDAQRSCSLVLPWADITYLGIPYDVFRNAWDQGLCNTVQMLRSQVNGQVAAVSEDSAGADLNVPLKGHIAETYLPNFKHQACWYTSDDS